MEERGRDAPEFSGSEVSALALAPMARLCAIMVGFALITGCAREPTRPTQVPKSFTGADVDPVWSNDGGTIAFRRRGFSSAGPPGIYTIPSAGGPMRFITPGDFFWPTDLRFSPDDRQLLCVVGLNLVVISLDDFSSTVLPTYVDPDDGQRYATDPDWSPDGRRIVYSFNGRIRVFDLVTVIDDWLRPDPAVTTDTTYAGTMPRWSRDGTQIAFRQNLYTYYVIAAVSADGRGLRVLHAPPPSLGESYHYLAWYAHAARGMDGVICDQDLQPGYSFYVDRGGTATSRLPYRLKAHQSFSPNGEWLVEAAPDLHEPYAALFVQEVGDPSGASRRQLTFWDEPASAMDVP